MPPIRLALLTTDDREAFKRYELAEPVFGAAPTALLQGFATLGEKQPDAFLAPQASDSRFPIEIHVVSCTQRPIPAPEKIADNIFFHSLVVPKTGWMRTGYLGCIRAVRRKLRTIRPDIVHGQGTERDCGISAIFSGYPNVTTIHGNMAELARLFQAPPFSFYWLAARLETVTLGRTMGVFCNSAYTQSLVEPRARRVWRVANPIRRIFFEPPATPFQPGKPLPVILNVGAISPRKRQVEILDFARELWRSGSTKIRFDFAGHAAPDSDYGRAFLHKIKEAGPHGYGRYLGVLNERELVAAMDASDGFLHFPFEEAFGLVVAEAMARGLKFFGSRLGGIIDISAGCPEAELYDLEDWRGLGKGLAEWAARGAPRSPEAASLMASRYHPAVIAKQHLEIYREVLARKSPSRKRNRMDLS